MSSYNNIEKIKYASPDCVVTLREYIVFEDERAEEKYVVFKFSNNVSQQLLGMEFEVSQFDIDGNLIEKSIVIYNKFLAKPNEAFVPNAKLKVNYLFKTLSVRLVQAAFDRFLWKEGQFLDNSYKFVHYAADRDTERPAKAEKEVKEKPVKAKKEKKRKKLPFKIKDATRKNIPKFPAIFNFIICAVVIAAIGASIYLFNTTSTSFTLNNYDLKIVDKDAKTVTVTGYGGKETDIEIPDKIDEYTIVGIGENAFKNSEIETVTISCPLRIAPCAFEGCKELKTVISACENYVLENAFLNCDALYTVYMPVSYLYSGSLANCINVKTIIIGGTNARNINDLLGGAIPNSLPFVVMPDMPDDFTYYRV